MIHLKNLAIISSLFCVIATSPPAIADLSSIDSISLRLEKALNKRNNNLLNSLISEDDNFGIIKNKNLFLNRFPKARWKVKASKPLRDGRSTLEVLITNKQQIANQKSLLEAKQKVAIETLNKKITSQEVISHYSILKNTSKTLPIKVSIPDVVLTGTSYDIDIIFEDPLGEAIIAGGLVKITDEQLKNHVSPNIDLTPLGGGGLFKSVQAPLNPGTQNWSALLAHPDGLISITKLVKVVSNKNEFFE